MIIFLNGTIISDTGHNIYVAMVAIIDTQFLVLGCEILSERRSPISMEKNCAQAFLRKKIAISYPQHSHRDSYTSR